MTDTCETCRYYAPVKTGYKEEGRCRFSPPAVVPIAEDCMGVWPRVQETDWCGQYSAKEKKS